MRALWFVVPGLILVGCKPVVVEEGVSKDNEVGASSATTAPPPAPMGAVAPQGPGHRSPNSMARDRAGQIQNKDYGTGE